MNRIVFICSFIFSFFGVSAQTEKEYVNCSRGVQYQYLTTYDLNKLNKIFTTELEEFLTGSPMPASEFKGKFETPKYAVKLFRVKYNTVIPELGNKPTVATGLVAIPDNGKDSMPILSYQHGTVFSKTAVPSIPDECMEYKLMVAQYASQGYVVIGADYIGLGNVSDMPNSYLIKETTEQACVDMLFAAKDILEAKRIKSGPLFLHGWSQGGYNTMTFLRKLEELNIPVAATATASAPVDPAVTINRWLNNYQPGDAIWLTGCASILIFSMERYYHLPGFSTAVIRPEYYQAAKDFADFKIDFTTLASKVPGKIKDYFKPEFLQTGNIANETFWKLLENSQAYRWRCHTPLINYYGESDEVIPVFIATLPESFHKLMGGGSGTRSVSAGAKADHRATHVYSLINAKPWFDSFLRK
jgi:hypothetical protein